MAAFISAPDLISAKEMYPGRRARSYGELGWRSLLADVVRVDRFERVGGTLNPRPTVAPR